MKVSKGEKESQILVLMQTNKGAYYGIQHSDREHEVEEHLHSGTFEVMYVISGELTAYCDGVKEIVRVGRCIIVLKDITIGLKTIPTTMLYILLQFLTLG